MKNILISASLSALALVGCKDKSPKKAPEVENAAKPLDTKPLDTSKPAKPTSIPAYSPQAAKTAFSEMEQCTDEYECEPALLLATFGANVSEQLTTVALDKTKTKAHRKSATVALSRLKDLKQGAPLLAGAQDPENKEVAALLYLAAAKNGGSDVHKEILNVHLTAAKASQDIGYLNLSDAIEVFDKKDVVAWASAAYPANEQEQLTRAQLLYDASAGATLVEIETLLTATTHPIATLMLAAAAVSLDGEKHLEVLIDGVKNEDPFHRLSSAQYLADVSTKIPAERRAEIVELVTAARKNDTGEEGGMNKEDYSTFLETLKG